MPEYPVTKVTTVTDRLHGHDITDNFRWLEESDVADVLDWSQAQNAVTARELAAHAPIKTLQAEIEPLLRETAFGLPYHGRGWYYWNERTGEQNQSVMYRRHGLDGVPEVLLNPNTLSADGTVSVTNWGYSPFNRYFWYVLTEKGAENGTFYLRDLSNGIEQTADTIPHVRHPAIAWLDDETGFFYTRHPRPRTVPKHDEQYYARVARHLVGRDWTTDDVLFGEGRHKEDSYGLALSRDNKTLIISASREWTRNELYLLDVTSHAVKPFITDLPAKFSLHLTTDWAYLKTNFEAEFGRLLAIKPNQLTSELSQWQEILPEVPGQNFEGYRLTSDYMLTEYLTDAHSTLQLRQFDGSFIKDVPLPPLSTVSGMSTTWYSSEFFYSVSSYTLPVTSYRYDPDDHAFEPYRSAELAADLSGLEAVMEWATSRDGTKIPLFVVRPKDLKRDGTTPTILYGYGGFNHSITPGLARTRLPWLLHGGVWIDAILRGGGEYGDAWHKAGMTPTKQNTFDDFVAVAERLIELDYTSPEHLGIRGGSNGGLLVAACAVQRPDLFGAVICEVPLIDMVRFPQFLIASRWTNEYGDPTDPADFERILRWSPYHNVKAGAEYPPMLIMTGDHDTRVEPLHARKFAALMQATNQHNPILLRTEIDAGHGSGTPVHKVIDAAADWLGFCAWQLGLKVD